MRRLTRGCVTNQLKSLAVFAALAGALGFSGSASADGFDLGNAQFQAGGIGFVTPRYEGSKSYDFIAVPFVFPGGKDGDDDLSFTGVDSIQYRFIKQGPFEAGVLGGANFGRNQSDGDKVRGWGDIDGGLILGGFGAVRLGYTKFTASYHHQVTGDDVGGLIRLRGDLEMPVSPGMKFLAGVGTNYATNQYIDTNFGVTAAQAAASVAKLPIYNPSAGFADVFVGAGVEVDLTDRWTAKLYGEYSRIIGDAANSPVIETEDQFTGLLAITYQFGPLGNASNAWAPGK